MPRSTNPQIGASNQNLVQNSLSARRLKPTAPDSPAPTGTKRQNPSPPARFRNPPTDDYNPPVEYFDPPAEYFYPPGKLLDPPTKKLHPPGK
jgi:hypothetical protein